MRKMEAKDAKKKQNIQSLHDIGSIANTIENQQLISNDQSLISRIKKLQSNYEVDALKNIVFLHPDNLVIIEKCIEALQSSDVLYTLNEIKDIALFFPNNLKIIEKCINALKSNNEVGLSELNKITDIALSYSNNLDVIEKCINTLKLIATNQTVNMKEKYYQRRIMVTCLANLTRIGRLKDSKGIIAEKCIEALEYIAITKKDDYVFLYVISRLEIMAQSHSKENIDEKICPIIIKNIDFSVTIKNSNAKRFTSLKYLLSKYDKHNKSKEIEDTELATTDSLATKPNSKIPKILDTKSNNSDHIATLLANKKRIRGSSGINR